MTVDSISPLRGWHHGTPDVELAEIPFLTQVNLRTRDPASRAAIGEVLGVALPTRPCTAVRADCYGLLWLGPDEWLVLAQPDTPNPEALLRQAIRDGRGAVTDVSAQRTTIRLAGSGVRVLLAKGCAIDLHPSVSPPGTCVQTLLARTGVVLVVRPDDVLLLVRSSYAQYLAEWLTDACTEL